MRKFNFDNLEVLSDGFPVIENFHFDLSDVSFSLILPPPPQFDVLFAAPPVIDVPLENGTSGNDTIFGSQYDDLIYGWAGNDIIYGLEGADELQGGSGNDTLYGGIGYDFLMGSSGSDILFGGAHNDRLQGSIGLDEVYGGDGNDVIYVYPFDIVAGEIIDGGAGYDTLYHDIYDQLTDFTDVDITDIEHLNLVRGFNENFDVTVSFAAEFINSLHVLTLSGPRSLNGEALKDVIFIEMGGQDDIDLTNLILLGQNNQTFFSILGDDDSEIVIGTSHADIFTGAGGDDAFDGGDGPDIAVYSGNQADYTLTENMDGSWTVSGADGTDTLWNVETLQFDDGLMAFGPSEVTNSSDIVLGTNGNDILRAHWGDDEFIGSAGDDSLDGGRGQDILRYNEGLSTDYSVVQNNDGTWIVSSAVNGTDTLTSIDSLLFTGDGVQLDLVPVATANDDIVRLTVHNAEVFQALDGDDIVIGTGSDEEIYGDAGDDVVYGYAGSDQLYGGTGFDQIFGGSGNDSIHISPGDVEIGEIYDGGAGGDRLVVNLGPGSVVDLRQVSLNSIEEISVTQFSDAELWVTYEQIGDIFSIDSGADAAYIVFETGIETYIYLGNFSISSGSRGLKIIGDDDAEEYFGSSGKDIILAGGGDDVIFTGNGRDYVEAGAGDDYILETNSGGYVDGGSGNDIIRNLGDGSTSLGDDGDDYFEIGKFHTLDGGNGFDTVDYSDKTGQIRLSLETGGTQNAAEGTSFANIERVLLGSNADIVSGDDGDNVFEGNGGNDQLSGRDGNDTLIGGAGNDVLRGENGDDVLSGGEGADQHNGASGFDLADYSGAGGAVELSLASGGTVGDASGDTFFGVEGVIGSSFDDVIEGNNFANLFWGGGGDDVLNNPAGAGIAVYSSANVNDYTVSEIAAGVFTIESIGGSGEGLDTLTAIQTVRLGGINGTDYDIAALANSGGPIDLTNGDDDYTGTAADETINGLDGNDIIRGEGGRDMLNGDGGDDILLGGAGSDSLNGGAGNDTASYADAVIEASVNLRLSRADGAALGDSYTSIENLTGSDFDDVFSGDFGVNILSGGFGDDELNGDRGNDILHGGDGNDALNGGDNDDTLNGDAGNDWLEGGRGNDVLYGGDGNDVLYGQSSGFLFGETANNRLYGGAGDDAIIATRSDLIIEGGSGFDYALIDLPDTDIELTTYDIDIRSIQFNGIEALNFTWGGQADVVYANLEIGAAQLNQVLEYRDLFLRTDVYFDTVAALDLTALTYVENSEGIILESEFFIHGTSVDETVTASDSYVNFQGGSGSDTLILAASHVDEIDFEFAELEVDAGEDVLDASSITAILNDPNGDNGLFTFNLAAGQFVIANIPGVDKTFIAENYETAIGWDGDDIFIGNGADNTFIGNAGADVAVYSSADTADYIVTEIAPGEFTVQAIGGTFEGIDTLIGIETIRLGGINGTDYDPVVLAANNGVILLTNNDDIYTGTAGDDRVNGLAGNDTISGAAGDDIIQGGTGNNTLNGDAGDDILFSQGNDVLNGGAGNDTVEMGGNVFDASTVTDGGADIDTISFSTMAQFPSGNLFLVIDLQGQAYSVRDGSTILYVDPFVSFENAAGSQFGDLLQGDAGVNRLSGLGGDDNLQGRDGDDIIDGGAGADILNGGGGIDIASYASALAGVTAIMGNAVLNIGDAVGDSYLNIENITGSDFDDILGGDGNANIIDGGAGRDIVSYAYESSAIIFDALGLVTGSGDILDDSFINIEGIAGTDFNDRLFGDNDASIFYGGAGADRLFGRNGDDELYGEDGNDIILAGRDNDLLDGGAGNDQLRGNEGDDTIFGGDGNDALAGGAGADAMDGGSGIDRVEYTYGTNAGVIASLGNSAINTGDAAGDTYVNIENLYGTSFNDVLYGDGGNNRIEGRVGDDMLFGGDGNDYLLGGSGGDVLNGEGGNDLLFGQAGADIYQFDAAHGTDRIVVFTQGEDLIEFTESVFDFSDLTITQDGAHVNIVSSEGTIIANNSLVANFTAADFIFASPPSQEPLTEDIFAQDTTDLMAMDFAALI